jgi:hypothetical protein
MPNPVETVVERKESKEEREGWQAFCQGEENAEDRVTNLIKNFVGQQAIPIEYIAFLFALRVRARAGE